MALIEIEILRSDDDLRSSTLQRAVKWLGPPDGTVVLARESGDEFTDELIDEVLDAFGEFGEIILVRYGYFLNHIYRYFGLFFPRHHGLPVMTPSGIAG